MTIPTNARLGTIVYRADARYTDYSTDRKVDITYDEYEVTKITPKGAWVMPRYDAGRLRFWAFAFSSRLDLHPGCDPPKWYPFTCRFVSTTKEEALEGLRIRKIRHRMHAQRRLIGVEDILKELGVELKNPVIRELSLDTP